MHVGNTNASLEGLQCLALVEHPRTAVPIEAEVAIHIFRLENHCLSVLYVCAEVYGVGLALPEAVVDAIVVAHHYRAAHCGTFRNLFIVDKNGRGKCRASLKV